MKNFKLILTLFALSIIIVSCDNDDNTLTGGNSDSGWIQFDDNGTSAIDSEETIEIPYSLPYGTNAKGITLTYSIELLSGSYPSSGLGNFTTRIESGDKEGTIDLPLQNIDTNYDLLFTLISSSNTDYQIGLSDGSKQTTFSLSVLSSTYMGDAYTTDLGAGPGELVNPYTVTVTPTGDFRSYSIDTSWGPEFVPNLCGGCVGVGDFPNASTVTINSDNSVTTIGDNGSGTGTFDPETNTFTLSIVQELFANDFNADVILTGN